MEIHSFSSTTLTDQEFLSGRNEGKPVQLTEYAGAGHTFDAQAFQKPLKRQKGQTTRQCELAEAQDGVVVNAKTKLPFTYADSCVVYGQSHNE